MGRTCEVSQLSSPEASQGWGDFAGGRGRAYHLRREGGRPGLPSRALQLVENRPGSRAEARRLPRDATERSLAGAVSLLVEGVRGGRAGGQPEP